MTFESRHFYADSNSNKALVITHLNPILFLLGHS